LDLHQERPTFSVLIDGRHYAKPGSFVPQSQLTDVKMQPLGFGVESSTCEPKNDGKLD